MSLERNAKKRINKKQRKAVILDNDTVLKEHIDEQKESSLMKGLASINQLSEIEKDVLNLAEEIFKLKKYDSKFSLKTKFDMERYPIIGHLYSKSVSKFHYSKGYSKEEIFLGIRNLEKEGWIVSEGRRSKLEILNDDNYKEVIEFIRRNPGVHALDHKVEKELGITRSPFIKRVIRLIKYRIIRTHKIGKLVHFFLINIPSQYDEMKALFLNPLIPKIIMEISKDQNMSGIQLADILNEPVHKIHYYIKKIEVLEIIKRKKNQSGRRYYWINKNLLSNYNKVFKEPNFYYL
jgi:DNA-binding MarR family transcriptional regulator